MRHAGLTFIPQVYRKLRRLPVERGGPEMCECITQMLRQTFARRRVSEQVDYQRDSAIH